MKTLTDEIAYFNSTKNEFVRKASLKRIIRLWIAVTFCLSVLEYTSYING